MIKPTLAEARELAAGHSLIPIMTELYADLKTPVEVMKTIRARSRGSYMLESAPGGDNWGRHTFLGYDPLMEIKAAGNAVAITRQGETEIRRGVKKLSHVCHIASKVSGRIAKDYDALDAIAAALPADTLSGAPKKRACEIIDAVENAKRGPYGGAVGYIDFNGGMDLCIGIRMAVLKDNQVYAQAGAGIVADSDPAKEYQECLRKAAAVIEAVETAGKAVLP
jgi:anthranilate/para-aminobenzoate synthase component I